VRGREGRGVGGWRGGKGKEARERKGRDLPDQCQTASYAPAL